MKIGAQLYTLHTLTQTLDGFSDALKRVADIGYTSVQVSGTCAYEPEWLAEQLKANGLTCDLTHYDYEKILADPEKVVADHKIFGCKYIGLGSLPGVFSPDANAATFTSFIENAVPAAKRIAAAGGYFMYHNHAAEFKMFDGKLGMDYLTEAFAPREMGFTLDTHWVKVGGYEPVEWLNKLAGRTPCVHYKDLIVKDGKNYYAPVGSGVLDFDAIIKTSIDNGEEYAFVEQDDCYGEDPYACLKKSYEYLKSMGLN